MFEKTVIQNLLTIVSAYCAATGRSLTSVSKDFYGRGDFFAKLREGDHTISIGRLSEMLDKFRREWPRDASWPLTRPIFMSHRPPKK